MEQVRGDITYNGYRLNEFVPKKTSAYISQNDVHVGEMTVKETLDFSARCQGVGTRYGNLQKTKIMLLFLFTDNHSSYQPLVKKN